MQANYASNNMNVIHAINANRGHARLWIYTQDDTGEITLISGNNLLIITRTIISWLVRPRGAKYRVSFTEIEKDAH